MLGDVGSRQPEGCGHQASRRITHLIAEMFALDVHLFSTIHFHRFLQDAYPWYTSPAQTTLSWSMMVLLYRTTRDHGKAQLSCAHGKTVHLWMMWCLLLKILLIPCLCYWIKLKSWWSSRFLCRLSALIFLTCSSGKFSSWSSWRPVCQCVATWPWTLKVPEVSSYWCLHPLSVCARKSWSKMFFPKLKED